MPRRPPVDEADAVRQALIEEQIAKRDPGRKVPLPNGVRMTYQPAVEPHFQGMNFTGPLGDPATILKETKPGCKYVWKKRMDRQTSAWIRAGILRPVNMDEIDTTNPNAELFEDVLPSGDPVVTYESLALFEMSAKWVKKIYEAPEQLAMSRVAQQAPEFAAKVNQESGGAYQGKFNIK